MSDTAISLLTWVGLISSAILLITIIVGIALWVTGILPVLLRLGNGLARRKISIFAKADKQSSLKDLLLDSSLFLPQNIHGIAAKGDIKRAEETTLFLVCWEDWGEEIQDILQLKTDKTALVIYALPGSIPHGIMKALDEERNVVVTNFRGRLINDLVICMITTGYKL